MHPLGDRSIYGGMCISRFSRPPLPNPKFKTQEMAPVTRSQTKSMTFSTTSASMGHALQSHVPGFPLEQWRLSSTTSIHHFDVHSTSPLTLFAVPPGRNIPRPSRHTTCYLGIDLDAYVPLTQHHHPPKKSLGLKEVSIMSLGFQRASDIYHQRTLSSNGVSSGRSSMAPFGMTIYQYNLSRT
jgi:hypothetical protein